MIIYRAFGFQPHGYNAIRPLPEGGWFLKNNPIDGPHFLVHIDKPPESFVGICPIESVRIIKCKYYGSSVQVDAPEKELYRSPSKFEDCVPCEGVFAGIFTPRDRTPVVFGHHLLPKNEEAFRAALGVPEDRHTLVISKTGGHFCNFDLPYQKTACCMPSCDGLTILVAQEDSVTIIDNPL